MLDFPSLSLYTPLITSGTLQINGKCLTSLLFLSILHSSHRGHIADQWQMFDFPSLPLYPPLITSGTSPYWPLFARQQDQLTSRVSGGPLHQQYRHMEFREGSIWSVLYDRFPTTSDPLTETNSSSAAFSHSNVQPQDGLGAASARESGATTMDVNT